MNKPVNKPPVNKPVDSHSANELTPKQLVKIIQLLDESAKAIDSKTLRNLEQSRKQAVAVLENRTLIAEAQPVVTGWGHALELSQNGNYRLWVMALVLLAVLSAALGTKIIRNNRPLDTDALVLASELPPEAYTDKEFVAWLDHTSRL
jgi:uncharacterized protein DUF3619